MQVKLIFVPAGGGEADYQLAFDLPAIPQPGDYISIRRPDQDGTEDFIVRRTLWELHYPGTEVVNDTAIRTPTTIFVECEFAIGPFSSKDHRAAAQGYGAKEFEETAY